MSWENRQAYFNNPQLWSADAWHRRAGDQERARLADEWLPADAHSVLDVGCGNGVFSNLVRAGRFKVGMDLSRAALSGVKAPSLQADATSLPFADHSFDACVCMEMLEHLPRSNYRTALSELVRISARYILITVPYNEKLEYYQVTCPKCLNTFHPFHHVRSFQRDDFKTLFSTGTCLERLAPIVARKSEALPGLWNLFRSYLHRQGRNFPSDTICPQCGYTRANKPLPAQQASKDHLFRRTIHRIWPMQTTFTWWMALYRKID